MIRKSRKEESQESSGTYAELEPQLKANELYELEWIELHTELVPGDDLKELRRIALSQGGFKAKKLRSIYWALLLGVLGRNPYEWLNDRRTARNRYALMREQFNRNPHRTTSGENTKGKNVVSDDPLSQTVGSVWHQHFCDQELNKLINQDVARTFPGMDFFRREEIQHMIASILFCYARAKPQICYRQGMHELLGPLLFVMHTDHQHLLDVKRMMHSINPTIYEVLDPAFMEADAYYLFLRLMERMETYYKIRNVVPNASGELPRATPANPSTGSAVDELDMHIKWMRTHVLSRHDPEVDAHLTRLNIPLSVIGIRWYRVLFGREFSFGDLLTLWDAIFADNFQLIKYLPAAMLISVRRKILTSDFIGVYECLMSFQDTVDIRKLIKYSLYLKDDQKYKRPEGVFVAVPQRQIHKVESANFIPRSGTLPSRSFAKRPAKKTAEETRRPRANSLKRVAGKTGNGHHTSLKSTSADLIANHHELEISDGYLEDDPAILKLNIEHMARLMAISRLKLQEYVASLREAIPASGKNPKVNHCLDGLEELCAFMEPRASSAGMRGPISPPAVERALAADEMEDQFQQSSRSAELTSTPKTGMAAGRPLLPNSKQLTQQEAKTEFVKTLESCDTSNSFVMVENPTDSQTLFVASASFLNDTERLSTESSNNYECPDHRLPRVAQKVIGNRKEVELVEINNFNNNYPYHHDSLPNMSRRSDHSFTPSANPQRERLDSI